MLTAQWAFHRVPVLHRIPLFSRTRMRVLWCFQWVAHLPQSKPGFMVSTFRWLILYIKQVVSFSSAVPAFAGHEAFSPPFSDGK